ncbi:DUF692 family multinuclear iron-containing protein [Litoribrevibacter euphylliae]|uniref:DUF692 family multinuclear iron-containing protein n=1 Tax=Litoribrevibacter euphylliae TaxID=1834034 RepID=A0ABV7HF46_9GAMM
MTRLSSRSVDNNDRSASVGVGLRHSHYKDALSGPSQIDFVEIHAENFFSRGSASLQLLEAIADKYPISLHSTSMGLGSASGINQDYLQKLDALIQRINPILVSDHASFSWSEYQNRPVHAGDLLPLEFTEESLDVMVENIDQVQQLLGRRILVENLSAYVSYDTSRMSEVEFLTKVVERSQCGLLVDLNNILVNAHNFQEGSALEFAKQWLNKLPLAAIGEIHLAGYSPVPSGELIIDDHSQAVSDEGWSLYQYALELLGPITTLVEWDNNLPEWQVLVGQAHKASRFINSSLPKEEDDA